MRQFGSSEVSRTNAAPCYEYAGFHPYHFTFIFCRLAANSRIARELDNSWSDF